ncbi:unnamed protein product [Bursaphelenchus xylophilus]|uniref:(pine wood nematode) hypothetical protein n=1 Tax=Bursaphelenchus xylophilus TaxID=6326 RepID=A0A1I7RVT4_BURXY|nr:unnamed protein product [Bursaphelenchus xylophilus]CAG9082144.1 unnamed protein product [Bursaphelenchus xylophilus]
MSAGFAFFVILALVAQLVLTSLDPIPESFEAAEKWPECADVINHIWNQGQCNSCWAVATAGAISDRICIATKGRIKVNISAIHMVDCDGKGCGCGDYPLKGEQGFIKHGLPTGGDYHSNQGCQPYPVAMSDEILDFKSAQLFQGTQCSFKCRPGYNRTYEEDLFFGKEVVSFTAKNDSLVESMQHELMKNGPFTITMIIYSDFGQYNHGIYRPGPNVTKSGYHAVRLIGWGVENGTKFWRVANSWGPNNKEHGFFRIVRGINCAEFEQYPSAVTIDTDRLPW